MQNNKHYTVKYNWEEIKDGINTKDIISKLLPNSKLSTDFTKNLNIDYDMLSINLQNGHKDRILNTLLQAFETLGERLKGSDITIDYSKLEQALDEEQEQDMENLQTFGPKGFDAFIQPQNNSNDFVQKFVNDVKNGTIAQQIIKSQNGNINAASFVDKSHEKEYQNVKKSSNFDVLVQSIKILFDAIQKSLGLEDVLSAEALAKDLAKQGYTKGGFSELEQQLQEKKLVEQPFVNTLTQNEQQLQEEKQQILWNAQFNSTLNSLSSPANSQKKLNEHQIKIDEQPFVNTLTQNEQRLQEEKRREYDIMRQKEFNKNNKKIDELSSIKGILNGIQKNSIVQSHNSDMSIKAKKTIDYSREVEKAYACVSGSKDKASLIKNFENLLNTINKEAEKLNDVKGGIIDTEYYKKSLETGLASIEGKFSEIKDGLKNAKDARSQMMAETVKLLEDKQKQPQVVKPKSKFTQHALKRAQPKGNQL